jgi:hypothetical protein
MAITEGIRWRCNAGSGRSRELIGSARARSYDIRIGVGLRERL